MKQRLILIGLVLMTMAGSVQGQGFLKKINGALDKVNKGLEKVANPSDSKKTSTKTSATETTTTKKKDAPSNNDTGSKDNLGGKKSNLYEATSHGIDDTQEYLDKISSFKTTANTKVVEVENLDNISLGYFSDNRAFVETGNVMLCIDSQGNVLKKWPGGLEGMFQTGTYSFPRFDSGRVIAYEEGEMSIKSTIIIYDTDFKVIKKIPDVEKYSYFKNGVALIQTETNTNRKTMLLRDVREELKFIDVNGNQVFKNLTESFTKGFGGLTIRDAISYGRPTSEGLIAYFSPKDNYNYLWGFRDASGKVVITAKYDLVQEFSNGLAAVATKGVDGTKWGFIDTKGNMVIAQKFSNPPSKFDKCGLALVKDKEDKFMYINKQGEVVSEKYDNATPFCDGQAIISDWRTGMKLIDSKFETITILSRYPNSFSYEANTFGTLNYDFNVDLPAGGTHGGLFYDGQIYLRIGSNYCLLDKEGNVKMQGLKGPFVNGIAPVEKWKNISECEGIGYVNEKGEWIVKFERSKF